MPTERYSVCRLVPSHRRTVLSAVARAACISVSQGALPALLGKHQETCIPYSVKLISLARAVVFMFLCLFSFFFSWGILNCTWVCIAQQRKKYFDGLSDDKPNNQFVLNRNLPVPHPQVV